MHATADMTDFNPLSSWDQVAPRAYMRQVYCFPYYNPSDRDLAKLRQRLDSALVRACAEVPWFEGRVSTPGADGRVALSQEAGSTSAVLEVEDVSKTWTYDYASLRDQGFPASAFVGPAFDIALTTPKNGQKLLHVVEIRARVIRGGLLLCIFVHHSVTDGIGLNKFVSKLAQYTRGSSGDTNGTCSKHYPALLAHTELPTEATKKLLQQYSYDELMQKCHAYWDLPDRNGPLAGRPNPSRKSWDGIAKTGRIFVLSGDTIAFLKQLTLQDGLSTLPSTFAVVVALTWVFVTASRAPLPDVAPSSDQTCSLVVPVSWARRAYTQLVQEYDGNTIAMIKVDTERDRISAAAKMDTTQVLLDPGKEYSRLVRLVQAGLDDIDDDFVNTHAAMLRAVPDPCRIGINHDPMSQNDFIMNSWRHFGADTQWGFHDVPGNQAAGSTISSDGIYPDAVRRGQAEWNMSAALILPGRKEARDYEIIVTLDTASMERLCANQRWMTWVKRVTE